MAIIITTITIIIIAIIIIAIVIVIAIIIVVAIAAIATIVAQWCMGVATNCYQLLYQLLPARWLVLGQVSLPACQGR